METYSSGNCPGFSPGSLLILAGLPAAGTCCRYKYRKFSLPLCLPAASFIKAAADVVEGGAPRHQHLPAADMPCDLHRHVFHEGGQHRFCRQAEGIDQRINFRFDPFAARIADDPPFSASCLA